LPCACKAYRIAIFACVNWLIIVCPKSTFLDTCVIKFVDNAANLELILAVPALCASLRLIFARLTQLTARPTLVCLLINIESITALGILGAAEGWVSGDTPTSALVQHWVEGLGVTREAEVWAQ
jgi:hypothetical protein